MRPSLILGVLFLAQTAASAQAAEPIYVRPGQCILIGSQQVCGLMDGATSAPGKLPAQRLHICQYGPLVGSELPNAKGYSHILLTIKEDGTKAETHIKSFGPLEEHQRACEAEAKRYQEQGK